jgi:excisionase family DNA binding protein
MLMAYYQNDENERQHALEDYLTIRQAIRHSGYNDQYLRRMAMEGRIDAIKVGQFWLFSRRSLQAFIDYANAKGTTDNRFRPKKLK